ncbi:hypothetical protein BHM03_00036898 [Ensete ventricosum]|uniref:Uncharacterized protein n=1 Tax=Ensete ventricosum TaxID=4639 RepID=A0A426YKS8_ENSVE|nr:hypothetical protein B296_00028261 [Ensete ventricosum]RZS06259.1 hypothetical protein BHM03_00036898 [Ensete ventricosum]
MSRKLFPENSQNNLKSDNLLHLIPKHSEKVNSRLFKRYFREIRNARNQSGNLTVAPGPHCNGRDRRAARHHPPELRKMTTPISNLDGGRRAFCPGLNGHVGSATERRWRPPQLGGPPGRPITGAGGARQRRRLPRDLSSVPRGSRSFPAKTDTPGPTPLV